MYLDNWPKHTFLKYQGAIENASFDQIMVEVEKQLRESPENIIVYRGVQFKLLESKK